MSLPAPRSAYEIRLEGWRALTERLGPAGAMRFMMQYDPGHGDYSAERHALFAGVSLHELLRSSATASGEPGERRTDEPR